MGERSNIAWTDATFNPWWGCSRVSPGCERCYAEQLATVRRKLPVWGGDADRKPMSEAYWREPEKWNRKALAEGTRLRVFCASMADVFEIAPQRNEHANAVMHAARERLWALIQKTPALDWLLLTKRPQNIRALAPWRRMVRDEAFDASPAWPPNVWIGTTVEDQRRAEERIPWLLEVPAAVRFLSCEPMLGPVDLENVMPYYLRREPRHPHDPVLLIDALRGHVKGPDDVLQRRIDWVITGGESGAKARPFDLEWARDIVRQCRGADVAVFVKQLGTDPVDGTAGGSVWLRDAKGGDPEEWPFDLRVQELPKGRSR